MECEGIGKKQEKKSCLISVIVPVYNIEDYVGECLESICNQTYCDLQIIVVDDGSTDKSGDICNQFEKKDSRICVIHKENGGLVSARKAGLKKVVGEYILNIDGDDWVENTMIESLLKRAILDNSDVVQCGYIREDTITTRSCFPDFTEILTNEKRLEYLKIWMSEGKQLGSQIFTKLFKASTFKKIYRNVTEDMSYGEDLIAFLYGLQYICKVSSMVDTLYHYRIRDNSLSHAQNGIELILKEDKLTFACFQLLSKYYSKIPKGQIEEWCLKRKMVHLKRYLKDEQGYLLVYKYSEVKKLIHKNIVVYGAGEVGRDYILQLSAYEDIKVTGWLDKNSEKYSYDFRKVQPVCAIENMEFDYIIIAVRSIDTAKEIRQELQELYHIKGDRILWDGYTGKM